MIIIVGAALVNILKPAMSEMFNDYASMFMEHIRRQFVGSVCCVDIVTLTPGSLNTTTRRKRGKGTRRRVYGQKELPANWPQFLRENDNMTELFHLLIERVTAETFPGKVLCSEVTKVEWL